MKWDLKELRGHVERLFGVEQLRTVNQCLRTIGDRREFSRYHFNEAKDRMEGALQGRETFELTAALLGAFDTDDRQFSTARFQAYAHTVACVQNMHAVVDNMVHFAYYVLGANLDPATRIERERDITWSKVSKKLVAGPIKDGLIALLDDPGFTYLAALSNHSKHRSIVEVSYSVNFESDAVEHGLRFNPFTYDGVTYPTKWVRPTLIDEYQRQEGLILTIGNAVNDELRDRS
ncbi:hypothetical protein [Stenotrophomonas maltophilia]|uniref:hypothetical protein n=1 Tax=Stenotrophomonas maltophilia TaxID=40324 RepID=UPI000C1618BF|nr:hypothetical protein [Stenotrophomonas maltophilia]EKT4066967.1 hypothetical protein [Stenotrophomonas maltophilia]EKT4098426.1 hypothetical protein [Stenotrophomonas maltophilia]EKT4099500.1 hypothetical protein [Stenotrophomonas maltophilia]MBA0291143.1 hypothetical protein [Stenotrophomonas maltophilia]QEU33558.1 hypothetical protein FOB57_10605 [Stenotrophomonas maltophilia]